MGSKVDVPATTDPTASDWQNFIAWVEKAQTGKINITFSEMDSTDEPKIQAGSIVEIAGSLYSFSAEEAATGWSAISDGTQAYMALSASGDTVSAEWTATPPVYRNDLQGWYESGTNKRYVLRCLKGKDTAYINKVYLRDDEDNRVFLDNTEVVIDLSNISFFPSVFISDSFDSPDTGPYALTYDSSTGNLISSDPDRGKIYIHDGISSTILSSFDSPGDQPFGLVYDSSTGNLISCDPGREKIYIHDGISDTILSSFDGPDTYPRSLAYDSSTGNLISCDGTTEKIYIHDGISSSILSSFDTPDTNPHGLAYDSSTGNLISCNIFPDKIYIHDGISDTILSSFDSPGTRPTGLAYDSSTDNLISCDSDTDKIYIHKSQMLYG